jgi:hypothetical protein
MGGYFAKRVYSIEERRDTVVSNFVLLPRKKGNPTIQFITI